MLDLMAAYELALIKARTKAGMRAKARRGECVGTAPVGYRLAADGRTLETNPAEAKVVATIHELRAAGMSMRAIGAELARLGITTRKGGPIQTTQIARTLAREAA
jgi:DNA invertase Pin-like site-specific DNA recombinase